MATRNENTTTWIATHPGTILKYELEERGISQKEFAEMIGMQRSHVCELIKGKRTLTKEEYVTEQLREHQEQLRTEVENLSDECLEIQTEAALEAQRRDQLVDEVVVLTKKKSFLETTLRGLEKTVEYFKKTVFHYQVQI